MWMHDLHAFVVCDVNPISTIRGVLILVLILGIAFKKDLNRQVLIKSIH